MGFDIRLPNITAGSDSVKIEQMRSYLYQLAEQMQWVLDSIETNSRVSDRVEAYRASGNKVSPQEAQNNFNSIKALIIKSADIVNAYYEEINKRLVGEYVAKSDFGEFKEQTENNITANSTGIQQTLSNIQEIVSDLKGVQTSISEVNAYITSGLLSYDDETGLPVYGLEIGQKSTVDGIEVYDRYARFTSNRMSFFDQNGSEVAYVSDYKLYITSAQITGTLTLGRYIIDTSNGLAFKWA